MEEKRIEAGNIYRRFENGTAPSDQEALLAAEVLGDEIKATIEGSSYQFSGRRGTTLIKRLFRLVDGDPPQPHPWQQTTPQDSRQA